MYKAQKGVKALYRCRCCVARNIAALYKVSLNVASLAGYDVERQRVMRRNFSAREGGDSLRFIHHFVAQPQTQARTRA